MSEGDEAMRWQCVTGPPWIITQGCMEGAGPRMVVSMWGVATLRQSLQHLDQQGRGRECEEYPDSAVALRLRWLGED